MNYELNKDLRTLRPCCLSRQLDTILSSALHTLRSNPQTECTIPAEPEVTLSKIIDWFIWETPTCSITLYLTEAITPELLTTLTNLLLRDNVSINKPRRPLLKSIDLNLPSGTPTSIPLDTFLHRFKDRCQIHYRRKPISQSTLTFTDIEDFRRNKPFTLTITGSLPQTIKTRMHQVTLQLGISKSEIRNLNS